MQTFLPYPSFIQSARVLDYRRLGKQRVEVKQLLQALGIPVGTHRLPPTSSWENHPAAKMWRGYEGSLAHYGEVICEEWRRRGYNDSLLPQFRLLTAVLPMSSPPWLGRRDFHLSHRSNLIRKDPGYYRPRFGDQVPENLEYVWPTN
jgi:Pyrimidine dimer DNA glycosylase